MTSQISTTRCSKMETLGQFYQRFTLKDPYNTKIQSSLWILQGSTNVKAAHKTLVKSTALVNISCILVQIANTPNHIKFISTQVPISRLTLFEGPCFRDYQPTFEVAVSTFYVCNELSQILMIPINFLTKYLSRK